MKALPLVLLLAGCAGLPMVDGGVTTVTNTVGVPVAIPCFVAEDLPALPARSRVDPERATTDQLAAAAAADAEVFSAYARAADALLRQCLRSTIKPGDPNVQTRPVRPAPPVR